MLLAIDTALEHFIITIKREQHIWGDCLPQSDPRTRTTLDFINQFFTQHSLNIDEITQLAVGIGPGPYIGLRTGVSLINGLAAAHNLQIYPICSLLILCPNAGSGTLYRQNARRGEEIALILRQCDDGIECATNAGNWTKWDGSARACFLAKSNELDKLKSKLVLNEAAILNPPTAVENLFLATEITASLVTPQVSVQPQYLRAAR